MPKPKRKRAVRVVVKRGHGGYPGTVLTLTQVLAKLGYTHGPRASEKLAGRAVMKDGVKVWEGSAHECWVWLRETRQIT